MICPRCADEQIEVMAKSPVKMSGRYISASIAFIPGAIPTAAPYQPRTLSRSVPHDAEDIDDAPMVPSIPPLLVEGKR